jgi:hypothetical protein
MNDSQQTKSRDLGWRAPILKNFTREIAAATRLTVVTDPDQLLAEQEILSELLARGFELVPFDDHVKFRFAYESRYRQIWDRGEKTNLVVVLRSSSGEADSLPFDLLEKAKHQERCLSFSVAQLFPNLSPNVVLSLDRSCFQALYSALEPDTPRMGEDATKDFVLRHVFEIAPELIKSQSGLLKVLIRRHYRGLSFPPALDERFIYLLGKGGRWKDWPLDEIVPNQAAFLGFLDERWPYFLKQVVEEKGDTLGEPAAAYGLTYSGPTELPFGHDDVKIYIDNLFQEGQLTPVDGVLASALPEAWMRMGVTGANGDDKPIRFERLLDRLEKELPGEDANHLGWVNYARTWAEWAALRWEIGDTKTGVAEKSNALHDRIESCFAEWMGRTYPSLNNLAFSKRPAMVHHIAPHMAHDFTATGAASAGSGPPKKYALLVVDGLAMDQWVVLKNGLMDTLGPVSHMEEDGCFAWVPTLTSVSRQAIFAGKAPHYFATSLSTTSKEPTHWKNFWDDNGAKRVEVGYVKEGKSQDPESFRQAVLTVAEHPKMRMLGVVVGKVDQSMHGIEGGSSGLHAMVCDWARNGGIGELLSSLLDLGYEITLTADHGNIHGSGIGKPNAGVIADERGERAHVFNDELTRAKFAQEYAGTIEWPQTGLPDDWRALLAPGRGAFVPVGKHTVGHGGIAMEEVIVPFVKISRGSR